MSRKLVFVDRVFSPALEVTAEGEQGVTTKEGDYKQIGVSIGPDSFIESVTEFSVKLIV